MEPPPLPRFEATQRRDFLKKAAAIGALALIPGLASCSSKGDEETFAGSTDTRSPTTTTTSAASGSTTEPTTSSAEGGAPLPDGAALEVAYTFTAGGEGGPSRNPYVAVWVESPEGDLVANLSVRYNPPKGDRWINNLASWYTAVSTTDSSYLETTTGATQPAGAATVTWDGTGADGERVPQGSYVVFIESAQEHGNHSLTSAPITLGTAPTTASLPDDTDLSAASATYSA